MNPDVSNTATEIKKYFYEFKRTQLSKPYSPADRYRRPEIWQAAAEKCIQLKADPYTFIRAAFMFNNVPGGPFPHQMAGQGAANWYSKFCHLHGADGKTELEVMEQEVKSAMINGLRIVASQQTKPWTVFLTDDFAVRLDTVPAWVRVFLLPHSKEIMAKWGRVASQELTSSPHLLETVQKLGYKTDFINDY